jgi:hypothetical protein
MSTIKANKWQNASGAAYNPVIQVVTAVDTAYRTFSSSAGTNTIWVQATIARKSTTSKIKIDFTGMYGSGDGNDNDIRLNSSLDSWIGGAGGNSSATGTIYTGGTDNQGWGGTWTMRPVATSYLYTPSGTTSSITISVYFYTEGTQTIYANRDGWGGGGTQSHNTVATLVLSEVDY